jgi:hypothetical protein
VEIRGQQHVAVEAADEQRCRQDRKAQKSLGELENRTTARQCNLHGISRRHAEIGMRAKASPFCQIILTAN